MIRKLLLLFAMVGLTHATSWAACDGCCTLCGKKVCQLTVSVDTEKEDCFEIECEEICIPPVRFPWQSKLAPCCPGGCDAVDCVKCQTYTSACGKIRTIKKLVTEQREVTVCKYDWKVVIICAGCRHSGASVETGTPCDLLVDPDLIPYQDHAFLNSTSQSKLVEGRGTPLITPAGDLLYGPVEQSARISVAKPIRTADRHAAGIPQPPQLSR